MPFVLGLRSLDGEGFEDGDALREPFADAFSCILALDAAVEAAETGTLGRELRK